VPTVSGTALRDFAIRALVAAGLSPSHASSVAEGLVEANLRGVDSHGAVRLPQYARSIRAGGIEPDPEIRVVARRGATALVDAGGGYGFAPAGLAADLAAELAAEHGIGLAGVRASHHFGMGAPYAERIAARGMIGWLTTTSAPVMAPTGGARPVLGNNPLACAFPRRAPHPPVVLDMALSQVAYGRIRLAAAESRPIPLGWGLDEAGRPTTDAEAALAARLLAPVGDHKGYGLAVVAEVLAGVLTGSPFAGRSDAHGTRAGGVGHVFLAIDPAVFVERARFEDDVERLVAEIRAAPLADGAEEILLPGEPERRMRERRAAEGIPLSDELTEVLDVLAGDLGVASLARR
jgi:LDH2 family malate/lactate/ureidoglycolate dehydrogenase